MSTYGGDSWVPENLYRKRRVEELLREDVPEDEVRKLSNGRFACLVCPSWPVLDTMPMLQIHRKGTQHQAFTEKQRDKKLKLDIEIQKRIALGSLAGMSSSFKSSSFQQSATKRTAPLLAETNRIKAAVLGGKSGNAHTLPETALVTEKGLTPYVKKNGVSFFQLDTISPSATRKVEISVPPEPCQGKIHRSVRNPKKPNGTAGSTDQQSGKARRKEKQPGNPIADLAYQVAIQDMKRELRFKEGGWKRDGASGWSRDEIVEFDSDEEVPVNK